MPKQVTYAPEIHAQVLELIDQVFACHSAGGGNVALSSLMQLFSAQINGADLAELEKRGSINLSKNSDSGGSFINTGDAAQFNSNGITVKIPETIAGNYLSFTDNFVFDFSADSTISAGKLIFFVKVQDLDANQNKIDIDVSGDSFDQTIIHGPTS